MKKRIFRVLAVVAIILSMGLNVMAAGSIIGSLDRPSTSATDKNGNPVSVVVSGAKNYGGLVQRAVNAMNGSGIDDTLGAILKNIPEIDLTQIDRYEFSQVVEEHVNLDVYRFLSPVFDVSFPSGAPTADNPVKVKFVVNNMTDNMIVDVLHYCDEHGWEVLTGTKLSSTELEAEFHSASPVALIYRQKASLGTNVTSPKTGDVAVMPMLMLSVALGAAGVVALKKSKKNEYV